MTCTHLLIFILKYSGEKNGNAQKTKQIADMTRDWFKDAHMRPSLKLAQARSCALLLSILLLTQLRSVAANCSRSGTSPACCTAGCPVGYDCRNGYNNGSWGGSCVRCEAGKYMDVAGSHTSAVTNCKSCDAGRYR